MEDQEVNKTYQLMLGKTWPFLLCIALDFVVCVFGFLIFSDKPSFWPWLFFVPGVTTVTAVVLSVNRSPFLRFAAYAMIVFGFIGLIPFPNAFWGMLLGIIKVVILLGLVSLGPADDIRKHEDPIALSIVKANRMRKI